MADDEGSGTSVVMVIGVILAILVVGALLVIGCAGCAMFGGGGFVYGMFAA